ncbi:MAG: hypothetical protein EPN17_10980, partial [Methylobacter sp.]
NYNGVINLSYNVTDGNGGIIAATQNFSLAALNDLPVGSATAALVPGTEDTAYSINAADLLLGFSDIDTGDVLSVANLTATNGQLTATSTSWTFNPVANYNGVINLSYNVTDGNGGIIAATQNFSLAAVNDLPTGSVTISGNAVQGQLLTASNDLADADGLGGISYQWQANGGVINGATANTFTPTQNEVGKTVTVVASYTDQQGTAESVTSASTANVANPPVTIEGKVIYGTKGNDKLVGGNGNDSLFGAAGNDKLAGGNGDDSLFGDGGNDKLDGGAGNDYLNGGKGDDRLTGGAGADHFLFVNNTGEDKVLDFNVTQDFIHLAANTGVTAVNFTSHLEVHEGNVEIKFDEGNVTLVGVSNLDVNHVVFG